MTLVPGWWRARKLNENEYLLTDIYILPYFALLFDRDSSVPWSLQSHFVAEQSS